MKKILSLWKNMSASAKASIVFLFVSIVQKGLAYITTPIYTNLLTTDEYGKVAVFLTWFQLIGIVAMFSLQAGVFNNGMLEYKQDRDGYMFSMLILSNIITLITGTIFIGGYSIWGKYIKLEMPLVLLMFALFFTQPAMNFWQSRKRFEFKYKILAIATLSSCVLSPIVAVICIYLFPNNKIYARLFGAECTLIAFYLFFYVYTIIKARGRLNTSYWKFAFLFNLPLIPHYLSQYLLNSSDKLMISYLINDTQTAFYNVAYAVGAVVSIVWSAINTSLLPFTYENCEKKNYKHISNITNPLILLYGSTCLMIILFAPELISIMAPKEYGVARYVVPPIVGGVFFQSLYYIFANAIYYYKKPKYVMYASFTAAISNLILNYIFIPKYGFVAAGYTTLVCFIIQVLMDYFAMRKVLGFSIYNDRFLLIVSVVVIVISLVSNVTYDFPLIRYSIFAILVAILIVKRKYIISLVKKIRNKE